MVYFEDLGTTLDISIEEMEAFLDSEVHGTAHASDVRNFEVVETSGPAIVVTYERKFDGRWGRSRTRVTSLPPYCRFVEELEGVFAGSRFVGVHRPAGAKTRVELFGDIQCAGRSPDQVRTLWLEILAKSHDEDCAALTEYLRSRPRT